jgi:uncharacterized membrane protein
MKRLLSSRQCLWFALVLACAVSIGLYLSGAMRNHSEDFWYLAPNLGLAFIPLLLAIWLQSLLRRQAWKSPLPLIITLLLILFLPNSFYVVSDFIHLQEIPRIDIVQDVVMLAQFSFTGLAFGFISLFILHQELLKRVSERIASTVIATLLLLSSFAIYLGRDLRWNSWDIAVQPFTLVSDVVRRLLDPFAYPETFTITFSFFVMLGSMYIVLWQAKRLFSEK